ncbi:MAG: ABC transporter substrate-binding protein [Betaproteobacteria bacterium RIFCSPLOWO2_12_FULL_66_14]|nr:MAG: ABC transporter substrate-binding protein [Betaproteobacteria bacterium RIFCSPLOWO2_12_FULL_66_14]
MEKQDSNSTDGKRRKVLSGLAAAGAALSLPFGAPRVLAQGRPPFRIGVLNTFSKLQSLGIGNLNGMSLYFDEIGWQAGGRKIEIVKEDDEFNPQVGLQKLRKLVESDKVDLISGPQGSNVAMSIIDYVRSSRTFTMVYAGVTAISYMKIPYLFRTSTTTLQTCHPMAQWLYDNVAKECVVLASDFAGGRDVIKEFKSAYLAKGGKIIKEIYPPLNTNDYSAYLADVRSIAPSATFNFFIGSDAVRYVKQYDEFGLKGKIRLTGFAVIDNDTMPAQGKSALGGITAWCWTDTLDNPENRKFVGAYRAKYNAWPDVYGEYAYTAAKVIAETLNATNGESADKDRFAAAMLAVKFNGARGPFSFDPALKNVIQNVYIREAVELDGRMTNKVIATYRDVRLPVTPS